MPNTTLLTQQAEPNSRMLALPSSCYRQVFALQGAGGIEILECLLDTGLHRLLALTDPDLRLLANSILTPQGV